MCVVDDGHWLDRASAQTLAFLGRRLLADPVGVVIANREVDPDCSRCALGLARPRDRGQVCHRWAIDEARARGHGGSIKVAPSAEATLCNSLGRYEKALIAAENATSPPLHTSSYLALRELVEAAARSERPVLAAAALERLSESAQASGTDWALGVEARRRALLSTGVAAEALYREVIERLDRSPVRRSRAAPTSYMASGFAVRIGGWTPARN